MSDLQIWMARRKLKLNDSKTKIIVIRGNLKIRNLYMITDFVNRKNSVTLVHSLIISKVDYCNSLFIGLSNVILKVVVSQFWIEQQGYIQSAPLGSNHLLTYWAALAAS